MRNKLIALLLLCAAGAAAAEDPKGIRVRWYDVLDKSPVGSDHQMIEWGAKGEAVEKQLGKDCYISDWSGDQSCLLGLPKYGGWWADFGDDAPRAWQTTLYFIDGDFYRYFVEVLPERFELVETTLTKALGQPSNSSSSTVENRMGASFDQEIRIWELDNVDVYLIKRASKVTAGLLSVTYKPLAEKVPEEKAEAPF